MPSQRVAIVTGAARGIGAATAERLAPRRVRRRASSTSTRRACEAVAGRIRDAGGRAIGVGVDVTDAAQVEAGVARVADELGPPVVLVNNAGIIRDNLIFKMTEADWDAVMDVHLKGAFLMTKACQAHMTAEKLRPHRQPLVVLGPGQPRPGQLLRRQGRPPGLHQDPGHRARQVRGHGERRGAGLHPDRHDRRHGRADRRPVRGLHRALGAADPGRAGRPARGHRRHDRLPVSEEAGFVSGQVIYVAGGPLD